MRRRIVSFLLALAIVISAAVWIPSEKVEAYSGEKFLPTLNGNWISGEITTSGKVDYYKFVITSPGSIKASFQVAGLNDGIMQMRKADGTSFSKIGDDEEGLIFTKYLLGGSDSSPKNWSQEYFVDAGVYYVIVSGDEDNIGKYKIKLSFTVYNSNEYEPNDSIEQATFWNRNVTINGYASEFEDTDFFRITVPYTMNITFYMYSDDELYFGIYDAEGKLINSYDVYDFEEKKTIKLRGGRYYIGVASHCDITKYTIKWEPESPTTIYATTKINVSGYHDLIVGQGCKLKGVANPNIVQNIVWKSYQPKLATITQNGIVYALLPGRVTFRAYTGDDNGIYKAFAIYIKPKMMGTPTVAQPKSGQIRVTYAKQEGVTGYQVNYQMSGSTKSVTRTVDTEAKSVIVSNLTKGKTYNVKIRAYVKCTDGKVLYGTWSNTKQVKIK